MAQEIKGDTQTASKPFCLIKKPKYAPMNYKYAVKIRLQADVPLILPSGGGIDWH
jgi:hypothetical protein